MGLLCLDAKQHDHALEWISRAIRQKPKAEYLTSLGTTLQQQGRHDDALKAFDKAVQLRPDVAELWKNLGNILVDLQRPADALLSFQHALTLAPGLWHASHQCGHLLYNAGKFEEALPHLTLVPRAATGSCRDAAVARAFAARPEAIRGSAGGQHAGLRRRPQRRRHLQQYRRCPALAGPPRRGVAMVRPRRRAAAGLHRRDQQQGVPARPDAPVR